MKEIIVSTGEKFLVSDEDYDFLNQFNWCTNDKGSADHRVGSKLIKMHHVIAIRMGLTFTLIDHKDRNPYNNQRDNLRPATKSQNGMNRGPQSNNRTSSYKGVSFDFKNNKWKAQICIKQSKMHLGLFDTEIEAAKKYNHVAKRLHGEFAYLNIIPGE